MNCPKCDSIFTRVMKTAARQNGTRWRRYECNDCATRWSTNEDSSVSLRHLSSRHRRALTKNQALRVLTTSIPVRQLAEEYGVRHKQISFIRAGKTYKDVYEIVHGQGSAAGPICQNCVNWSKCCQFNFPEAGGTFAEECSLYESKAGASSNLVNASDS